MSTADPGLSAESVRVLRLQPGDVLIAKVDPATKQDALEQLRKRLELEFPGQKILVCLGVELEVARPEQSDGSIASREGCTPEI
jgi:hypothetical protein